MQQGEETGGTGSHRRSTQARLLLRLRLRRRRLLRLRLRLLLLLLLVGEPGGTVRGLMRRQIERRHGRSVRCLSGRAHRVRETGRLERELRMQRVTARGSDGPHMQIIISELDWLCPVLGHGDVLRVEAHAERHCARRMSGRRDAPCHTPAFKQRGGHLARAEATLRSLSCREPAQPAPAQRDGCVALEWAARRPRRVYGRIPLEEA